MAAYFEAFSTLFRKPYNTRVNVYHTYRTPSFTDFKPRTERELIYLYTSLIDVRIIEDFIADAVSKIPVQVVNSSGRPLKNSSRLSLLIDKSNQEQSWRDIIKELSVIFGITGNAFLLYSDDYLYTLSPANVRIDLEKPVELPEFMNQVMSYTLELSGMEYPLEYLDVSHIKTSQLLAENGVWAWGSSPYSAGIPVIEQLEALYSSRVSMIKDRGALGVLSNKSEIFSEDAMRDVKEKLKDYGTLADQDKYIVTTEDLSWQQMSLGSDKLQYLEQGRDAFAKLCELRGIDPLIFNAEGSTYANQEQGIKETYRRAIIPISQQIYDSLKPFLQYHYGGNYLAPDYNAVEELQDTGQEFSQKVISELSAGILTPEQAFNMLYDETEMEFEADKLKQENRQRMLDAVMTNRENGQPEEEEEEKKLIWTTS